MKTIAQIQERQKTAEAIQTAREIIASYRVLHREAPMIEKMEGMVPFSDYLTVCEALVSATDNCPVCADVYHPCNDFT